MKINLQHGVIFQGIAYKLKTEDEKDPEDELDMFLEDEKDDQKGETSKDKDKAEEKEKAASVDDEVIHACCVLTASAEVTS